MKNEENQPETPKRGPGRPIGSHAPAKYLQKCAYLPRDHWQALESIAGEEGKTLAHVVREACAAWLKKKGK